MNGLGIWTICVGALLVVDHAIDSWRYVKLAELKAKYQPDE